MYKCPNCSGEMYFSPEKQKLVCEYCDNEFDPSFFEDATKKTADEHTENASGESNSSNGSAEADKSDSSDKYFRATVFTCPQCGGELISADDTAATFCSFCGSSVLLESRVSNELKPDCIIPFKQSRADCEKAYKRMMARAWFAPSSMKQDSQIEKFRSIYMPYWIYSFKYDARLNVPGESSTRRGDYIITKHYLLGSDIHLDYRGISYDASSSFSDALSQAVSPFDLREAQDFSAAYITGHYADTKDVDSDVYEDDARSHVAAHAASELRRNNPIYGNYHAGASDIAKELKPKTDDIRLGFFPVWFLANRSDKGDRVSYAVVNGQSGNIAADLPVSIPKYLLGSLLLAVPIYLLLSFVMSITLTPRMLLIVSLILGLIGIITANIEMNRVYTRENNLDDKGWAALTNRQMNKVKTIKTPKGEVKFSAREAASTGSLLWVAFIILFILAEIGFSSLFAVLCPLAIIVLVLRGLLKDNNVFKPKTETFPAPFKDKLPLLAKPFAGIILSLVVVIINPFQDIIPYAAAIISLLLVVWCFIDIIRLHNRLTQRKLKQLGKRGGDENA